MAATAATLNDLEGHSQVAGLFKCNPSIVCAAVCTILTDSVLARFLCTSRASCSNIVAANATFWGCASRGLWPHIQTRPNFLYNAPNPHVSSSYVYSFGSYRVDKQTNTQTNKQTLLKTFNALRYATTCNHTLFSQKNKDKYNQVTFGFLHTISGWRSIRLTPAFSTPAILLLFPLLHFPSLQFCSYRFFYSRIFSGPVRLQADHRWWGHRWVEEVTLGLHPREGKGSLRTLNFCCEPNVNLDDVSL